MTQKTSERYSFMRLAKLIYPGVGYDAIVRRFQFLWRVISRYPYFNKIYQRLLDPVFEKATLRHPRLLEKAFRPHICSAFSIRERATAIVDHFSFLKKIFSDELIDVIYTESGKEIIKRLTHQCFGLRPKALILELVRLFAIAIECELLLAVTNKSHVYQARKKRHQRIKCSYGALWSEYSASEFNEKFVCLPLDSTYKPLEIVKSKKRAMYRRRYQLLEELKHAILLLHRYKRHP